MPIKRLSTLNPLCYWTEFSSVDISGQSSAKRSQSTANSKIWEPLAFADQNREVWKSWQNLVLQRGDHMAHVVPLFATGPNFQVSIFPANRMCL